MLIQVKEIGIKGKSTLSSLFIDGEWECFVLEDLPRDVKIKGETRIPEGKYRILPRRSGRHYAKYHPEFGHDFTMHIIDVPNFKWIMIHIGNFHNETDGCLLVGRGATTTRGSFSLTGSKLAYFSLYEKVKTAIYKEDVYIEIIRN